MVVSKQKVKRFVEEEIPTLKGEELDRFIHENLKDPEFKKALKEFYRITTS